MPQPKRHHSIPQFLLKRFAGPHGRLFVWRKADGKIWPTTPTDAFVEGYLYSAVDRQGQKNTTLETDYAALEGRVAPVVETIADAVANGLVLSLAAAERKAWDEFYFHQIIRVSEFMEQLSTVQTFEEKAETYLTAIETRFGIKVDETERAKILSPQGLARIKQNAKVTSLADPGDTVVGVLSPMSLEFGVSAGASRFVIGSQPVARLPVPTMEADKPHALAAHRAKIRRAAGFRHAARALGAFQRFRRRRN
jgi:hypothetical protein